MLFGKKGANTGNAPPPLLFVTPQTRVEITSESGCHQEKQGSKGQWGQMEHLAKAHFDRNGCDVIVAFCRHHDATSGTLDLGQGGPLVFSASLITERFDNCQAAARADNSLKRRIRDVWYANNASIQTTSTSTPPHHTGPIMFHLV